MRRNLKAIGVLLCVLTLVLAKPVLGSVEFGTPTSYPVGTTPYGIAVGDFNGDGKLDIAAANHDSSNVSILLGIGNGTFQAAVNYSSGNSPSYVMVGDFNGDGKLDLAVMEIGTTPSVAILLGNGDGTFQASKLTALDPTSNPSFLAAADFNQDKKADLAISTNAGVAILLGNGDGTFQTPTQIDQGPRSTKVIASDFNGDGKADLAIVNAQEVQIYLGKGDGTFTANPAVTPLPGSGSGPTGVVSAIVADINQDEKMDLLVWTSQFPYSCYPFEPCVSVTEIDVFLGNGDGTFGGGTVVATVQKVTEPSVGEFQGGTIDGVFVGDFNGDGKLDLAYRVDPAVRGGNSRLGFLLGQGSGSFTSVVAGITLTQSTSTIAADVNGDKLADLIYGGTQNDNAVTVQLNTSDTTGADLALFSSGSSMGPYGVGQNLTFMTDVVNLGPQDATGVNFTDTLPGGVTFVSATATKATCAQASGVVTCPIGDLASGLDSKVSIVVMPTATGALTNTMNVTATQTDSSSADNTATQTVTVVPLVTLTVTKSGTGTGTVSSATAINCGNTCTASVPQGTMVSLSATPDGSSIFAGWGGACSGADPNGCSVMMSATASVTATFNLAPDFSMVAAQPGFSIKTGQTVTDALALSQINAFTGQVNLSCGESGPAPAVTCSVSPSTVMIGSTSTSATLTIVAPANLMVWNSPDRRLRWAAAWALLLPMSGFLLGGVGRSRRRRSGIWSMGGTLFLVLLALEACGGGNPPPPPQTYTVTVTAVSANGSLQHSTTITVTVQQ
jgi:uncharacterized repeat protein (TIGR01451 family)